MPFQGIDEIGISAAVIQRSRTGPHGASGNAQTAGHGFDGEPGVWRKALEELRFGQPGIFVFQTLFLFICPEDVKGFSAVFFGGASGMPIVPEITGLAILLLKEAADNEFANVFTIRTDAGDAF